LNTKIKICGLTNYEDAKVAASLGADFLGFIQYNKSLRAIKLEKAAEIIEKIKAFEEAKDIKTVGVFVNQDLESIIKIANAGIFDILQLHGDESLDYVNQLKNMNQTIWKAVRVRYKEDLAKVLEYPDVDRYLLDNYKEDLYGGSGEAFDWSVLEYFDKRNIGTDKLILAGGVGVKNIIEALQKNLYAVDINSMIEEYAGKKNHEKMQALFELIKGVPR